MDISIEELLAGKPTVIKGKNYFPTRGYVEPFLERLQNLTEDFRVHVKTPDQLTMDFEGQNTDTTYNRIYIEAVMPDDECFTNHEKVIGMVIGLDCRKPVAKFYNGSLNSACTNLCVFSPEYLNVQQVEPETPLDWKPLDKLIQMREGTKQMLQVLQHTNFNNSIVEQEKHLGKWLRNAMLCEYNSGFQPVKLSTESVEKAYKDLFMDEGSSYYQVGNDVNMFDVYNAFTQQLTNARDKGKDLINLFEKTILLRQILDF